MKCPKCHSEITDNKLSVCPNCGKKIKKEMPVWVIILIVIFAMGFISLPIIAIVVAMIIPIFISNATETNYKAMFLKEFNSLNQSMLISKALTDNVYRTTDLVWEKSVKENLNIEKEIPNGIKLIDTAEIKYTKTKENCAPAGDKIDIDTACAILTIDVNGFEEEPNTRSIKKDDEVKFNDQFQVLLYADEITLIPNSVEETIIQKHKG